MSQEELSGMVGEQVRKMSCLLRDLDRDLRKHIAASVLTTWGEESSSEPDVKAV